MDFMISTRRACSGVFVVGFWFLRAVSTPGPFPERIQNAEEILEHPDTDQDMIQCILTLWLNFESMVLDLDWDLMIFEIEEEQRDREWQRRQRENALQRARSPSLQLVEELLSWEAMRERMYSPQTMSLELLRASSIRLPLLSPQRFDDSFTAAGRRGTFAGFNEGL